MDKFFLMSVGQYWPINSAGSREFAPLGCAVSSPLFALVLLYLVGHSSSLRLTTLNAPTVADLREDLELDCHFDMGVEELYAVKWYKDDQEFFRYTPRRKPNIMLFPVAGVHLDSRGTDCTSQERCKVKLQKLTRDHSSGAYRCEISSEAPSFRLASETHNITVAALPRQPLRIEGLTTSSSFYKEGDTVTAKCVSDFADPAPVLSWHINGQPATMDTFEDPLTSEPDLAGLVSRSISLRLPIVRELTQGSTIEIRCESVLPGVPVPPQVTTRSIPMRDANDPQIINNQKLHWYSGYSFASRCDRSFHIAWSLIILILAV